MAKTGKCLGTTQEEVLVAELVLHVGHVHQEAFCAQLVSRSPLAVSVLLDLVQALQSSLAFRPSQVFFGAGGRAFICSCIIATSIWESPLFVALDEVDVGA